MRHWGLVAMNYYGGSGFLESGELNVLKFVAGKINNEQQPVVFDVGAHKGNYLKQLLQILPAQAKIYSFEPSTLAFGDLQHVAAGLARVSLQNCGVGEVAGHMVLHYPFPGSALSSVHQMGAGQQGKSEEIKMVTLDSFCNENNIGHIHFLKMDIEGHEVAALKGARGMLTGKRISIIQFEFGQPNIASRTFLKDIYHELGEQYQIYRIVRNGFVALGAYSEENEVFLTTNYLAILR